MAIFNLSETNVGGGVELVNIIAPSATTIYYTDENMSYQTASTTFSGLVPKGTILATFGNGPALPVQPVGVTMIASVTARNGKKIEIYEVTG